MVNAARITNWTCYFEASHELRVSGGLRRYRARRRRLMKISKRSRKLNRE